MSLLNRIDQISPKSEREICQVILARALTLHSPLLAEAQAPPFERETNIVRLGLWNDSFIAFRTTFA